MITQYPIEEIDTAKATPLPRHIIIDGSTVYVYTGEDIPQDPGAAENE